MKRVVFGFVPCGGCPKFPLIFSALFILCYLKLGSAFLEGSIEGRVGRLFVEGAKGGMKAKTVLSVAID